MDEVSRRLVCQRSNIGSRVNREVHARFWERPGVRFLRATRRVSRASPVQTAVRNCTRDEGRSFEIGSQVLVSNHCKLLSSKAMVVSVAANVGTNPSG